MTIEWLVVVGTLAVVLGLVFVSEHVRHRAAADRARHVAMARVLARHIERLRNEDR